MKPRQRFTSVRFRDRHEKSWNELTGDRDFRLDVCRLISFFHAVPSTRLLDLLRIALSIYIVDRLARRRQRTNDRGWSRSLMAQIRVHEPDFWSSDEVRSALTECVDFVSGDNWDFSFAHAAQPRLPTDDRFLPDPDAFAGEPPLICLYSGGLDSAAGLASRIADLRDRVVLPVTVWHQPRQKKLICEEQYPLLRSRFGVQLRPLIIKVARMSSPAFRSRKEESSQRCRSFLFSAAAAAAAVMNGSRKVEVYESGIGAINLPMMAGMIGSKTTRSSHPEFLRRMSRVCTLAAGQKIEFQLPFYNCTKADLVQRLADTDLARLASSTVSCVHYPLRELHHKQCGVCPACLVRRQAMFVAGIHEPEGSYKHNVFAPGTPIPKREFRYLRALLLQVAQLGDLHPHRPPPPRVQRHLISTQIVSHDESPQSVVELLIRYREEWLGLAEVYRQRACRWAGWLGTDRTTQEQGVSHAAV